MTPKLIRDPKTLAILNTDADGLRAYKARRSELYKIETLNNDVQNIKTELADIKDLLRLLITEKNNG